MKKMVTAIILLTVILSGCLNNSNDSNQSEQNSDPIGKGNHNSHSSENNNSDSSQNMKDNGTNRSSEKPIPPDGHVQTISEPESIAALVNKQFALPDNYEPKDLVYPDVHFIFDEKIEKRMMRKEAAEALERMFAGAKEDHIFLGGVSAYRSHETQEALFNRYVQRDGLEKAKTYSAVPGHSEHETGLAIDVSGSDGVCAASDCFAGTKEAEWLANNAHRYGFIIRYPEGKEDITGYQYEPWHLRYVGLEIAEEIYSRNITLEEYFNAVPVTN